MRILRSKKNNLHSYMLAHFDPDCPSEIHNNASSSKFGIAEVLMIVKDGQKKGSCVVACSYTYRILNGADSKYHVIECILKKQGESPAWDLLHLIKSMGAIKLAANNGLHTTTICAVHVNDNSNCKGSYADGRKLSVKIDQKIPLLQKNSRRKAGAVGDKGS